MAGVIIAPASTRDTDVTPLLDLRIPVVALDRRLRGAAADTVLVDNERAAEEATEHLIDMGYRRIACITGPGQAMTARERLAGYRRALRGKSLRARPSLVRHADFREHGGFEAMASLLADADLDAVFVANNLMTRRSAGVPDPAWRPGAPGDGCGGLRRDPMGRPGPPVPVHCRPADLRDGQDRRGAAHHPPRRARPTVRDRCAAHHPQRARQLHPDGDRAAWHPAGLTGSGSAGQKGSA